MITPILKDPRPQGGTLYTFPSASRDLTRAFSNSEYEFVFSNFACLNLPDFRYGTFTDGYKDSSGNIIKGDLKGVYLDNIYENCIDLSDNLNITENRLRLLINKNSAPKTNDEKIVANIKKILEISVESAHDFELIPNGVLSLASRLYKDVKQVKFETSKVSYQQNLLTEYKNISKREDVKQILDLYTDLLSTNQYEIVSLVVNFYIDFINIKPFKNDTEITGLLLIYVLLFRECFDINMYLGMSDFEIEIEGEEEAINAVAPFLAPKGESKKGNGKFSRFVKAYRAYYTDRKGEET